jgi:hypothetical protein
VNKRNGVIRTSATGAERAVAVAALGAHANHLSVDILRVVGVDVAGAAAAVRYFGSGHVNFIDRLY